MSYKTKNEDVRSDYVYMHINNGGIVFKIGRKSFEYEENLIHRIPVLKIGASHMSVQTNLMEIPITPERLKKMGEWFLQMSEESKVWYENRDGGKEFDDGLLISCEKYLYQGDDERGNPIYLSERDGNITNVQQKDTPDGVDEDEDNVEILFKQQIDDPEIMTKDKLDMLPNLKYYNGEDINVDDAILWAFLLDNESGDLSVDKSDDKYKLIALKENDIFNFTSTGIKSGSKIPFVKKN